MTYRHLKYLVHEPVFPLSQFEHTFCFAVSVCFFMHKSVHLKGKFLIVCIYAVILIFLLPSDHVVYSTLRTTPKAEPEPASAPVQCTTYTSLSTAQYTPHI